MPVLSPWRLRQVQPQRAPLVRATGDSSNRWRPALPKGHRVGTSHQHYLKEEKKKETKAINHHRDTDTLFFPGLLEYRENKQYQVTQLGLAWITRATRGKRTKGVYIPGALRYFQGLSYFRSPLGCSARQERAGPGPASSGPAPIES